MKTVGIIGGLGPITTSEFYVDLNYLFRNNKNLNSKPPVVISNVPLPYQVEEEALLESRGVERYLPYLLSEAKRLETAGVDFLVMPCNSMHTFISELREAIKIPMLSIVEETVKFINNQGIKRIGVISTAMTLKFKLYEAELAKNNIQFNIPDIEEQKILNQIILNLVNGKKLESDRKQLVRIIDRFEYHKMENVILACTDLQVLKPEHHHIKVMDSMKIFVEATASYMNSD